MEKVKTRTVKWVPIVESYFVTKEIFYPSTPNRVLTTEHVPEFVLSDGTIMSADYLFDGGLSFHEIKKEEKPGYTIMFMNVPLCTEEGTFINKEISVKEAKVLCENALEIRSAVGHSGAAEAIETILNVTCPVNRIEYQQPIDEHVIAIKLLARMPEGCGNLTLAQMEELGFKFFHLERIA